MKRTLNVFGLLLLSFSLGVQAEGRTRTFYLDGLGFPGDPAAAKAQFFTNCTEGERQYTCERTIPTLFLGTDATKAWVSLNAQDNFALDHPVGDPPPVAGVPVDKLSYRSIHFEFPDHDLLEKNLRKQGWLKGGATEPDQFFKEGVPAVILVNRIQVTLFPAAPDYVNEHLALIRDRLHDEWLKTRKSESLLDYMKQ
ncbi:hypothetical protein HNP46_000537 [Pseudomonas nitritireducens]|uniref:Uncharacterized protein n=1 Tax=Pseudomonas nitroreducens TaxID=46680 RepID=A0A7W7NYR8_PSENT|nr:hypothetical protein [Pseudomonas nitritireducens]MBB4861726.1 hypothetical protein [Pseudomonas nitritireducens]